MNEENNKSNGVPDSDLKEEYEKRKKVRRVWARANILLTISFLIIILASCSATISQKSLRLPTTKLEAIDIFFGGHFLADGTSAVNSLDDSDSDDSSTDDSSTDDSNTDDSNTDDSNTDDSDDSSSDDSKTDDTDSGDSDDSKTDIINPNSPKDTSTSSITVASANITVDLEATGYYDSEFMKVVEDDYYYDSGTGNELPNMASNSSQIKPFFAVSSTSTGAKSTDIDSLVVDQKYGVGSGKVVLNEYNHYTEHFNIGTGSNSSESYITFDSTEEGTERAVSPSSYLLVFDTNSCPYDLTKEEDVKALAEAFADYINNYPSSSTNAPSEATENTLLNNIMKGGQAGWNTFALDSLSILQVPELMSYVSFSANNYLSSVTATSWLPKSSSANGTSFYGLETENAFKVITTLEHPHLSAFVLTVDDVYARANVAVSHGSSEFDSLKSQYENK